MACKCNRGFSLVELTITLGIMGVLAAFSMPHFASALRDMQAVSDARSIASVITNAKMGAMTGMTFSRVAFNLTGNTWRTYQWDRTDSAYIAQGADNALSQGIANSSIGFVSTSAHNAPSGFTSKASSTLIEFNSRGTPKSGQGVVYLSNADHDYAVTVSLSGKVQLWGYKSSAWICQ